MRAPRHLQEFPKIGRMVPEFSDENIRELIYGWYRIIYQIRVDDCFVVAIVHGRRDLLRLLNHDHFIEM